MKKIIYFFISNKIPYYFFVLLFLATTLSAQFKIDPRFENELKSVKEKSQNKNSDIFISPYNELPKITIVLPNGELKELYSAIIYTDKPEELKKQGILVQSVSKRFVTALISLEDIEKLRLMQEVISVIVPEISTIFNQDNVISSGAELLHSGALNNTNYTGKGILVGVFDTGIDFTHPDFREIKDKSKSRILKLWDQTINKVGNEKNPEGFDYGVEYSQEDINDEIDGTPANFVRQKDINGHGTHVAGIAAGNGAALPTFAYKGMAPEAELIIVKGGNGSFSSSNIIDGIQYFSKVATKLGKPIVINYSIGGQVSAHDGSSSQEQKIDEFVNSGSGRVAILAAGNDGSRNMHKRIELKPSEKKSIVIEINKFLLNRSGSIFGFITFNKGKENILPVTIRVTDPENNQYTQVPGSNGLYKFNNNSININIRNNIDLGSKKRFTEVSVNSTRVASPIGVYTIEIENNSLEDLTIDGWLYYANYGLVNLNLIDGDNYYTLASPGTAGQAITVANYVARNSYVYDALTGEYAFLNGLYSDSIYQLGSLASSSSRGPRADEAEKPDIAAGGTNVSSAASKDVMDIIYSDRTKYYVLKSGTSMASPAVTGAVALLLQANNNLSGPEVKSILKSNTTKYSFTTQNYTREFGFGKLNIFKAVKSQIDLVNNNTSCVLNSDMITLATDNINYYFGARVGTYSFTIKDKSAVKKITSNTNGVLNNISVYIGYYNNISEKIPLTIEIKKVNEDNSVGELLATKEIEDIQKFDMGGWNTISFKDANINLKEGESIYIFLKTPTYSDLELISDFKSSANNSHLAFNTSFTSTDGIALTPLTNDELKIRGFLVEEGLNYNEIKLEDITNAFSRLNVNLGNNHFVKDCKMQLSIDSNGSNPLKGFVISTLWIDNQEPKYVKRRFQINPESKDKFSTGKVTLYFTQEDFDEYNALNTINNFKLPSNKEDKASLENAIIYFAEGISKDNSGLVKSYETKLFQIPVKPENLVWNEEKQYWELSFDAIGFGGYLLGTRSKLANTDDLNIGLYPNPIKEYLNIQLPYNLLNANVKIYDTNGRLIRNYELKEINNKLDLNSLVKGVYFIEIKKANTKIIKKIIKI